MGDANIFCARTGWDEPGAWADLWNEAKVREYLSESLATAGVTADLPIKKLRVEIHKGPEDDGRLYIWGEDQPGFHVGDYADHEGLKVAVDGVVVYNDLRPAGDGGEIADHDPGCEDCAQRRA